MKLLFCFITVTLTTVIEVNGYYDTRMADELLNNCSFVRAEVYSPTCETGRVGSDNHCERTTVTIEAVLERFHAIDDVKESCKVAGAMAFMWTIPCREFKVRCTDMSYNVNKDVFWRPHIYHHNSVQNYDMDEGFAERFNAQSGNEYGVIKFYLQKSGLFESLNEMDFTYFPFDEQVVTMDFLIKENTKAVIFGEVATNTSLFPTSYFMRDGIGWSFLGANVTTSFLNFKGNRSLLSIIMRFRRQPDFFINNLMIPCLVLSSLQLASFLLHPAIPDRPALTVTILLALTVLQGQITARVPAKPQRVFLSNYTDLCTYFSWGVSIFALAVCFLVRSFKPLYKEKVNLPTRLATFLQIKTIRRIRIVDFIGFFVALFIFILINMYAISVAKITNYI